MFYPYVEPGNAFSTCPRNSTKFASRRAGRRRGPAAAPARARCASARRRARTPRAPRRGGPSLASRSPRTAGQQVVALAAPARRRARRRCSSPAAGPNAMRAATARLSSTTGDGRSARRARRRARRCATQSVSSGVRARAWQAAIAACSAYGPSAPPSGSARVERRQPAADQQWSQRARSWSSSRIGSPSGPTRARVRDAWISISATRPCTSGSLGRELGQDAAEPQRVLAERRPHPVVAGGGRVALVEDEVDDLEHGRRAARRARLRPAPRTAPAPRRACAWRARSAGRRSARARGTRGRSRRVVSAAEQAQRQRHARLRRQHRVAGGEDQAQQVVADVVVDDGGEVRLARRRASQLELAARAPRACARASRAGAAGRSRGAWRWP